MEEYHQKILTNLLKDLETFNLLESYTSQFNIFYTLGMANNELKHSNMLSFMLNPREKHNLGDLLIKQLIHSHLDNSKNDTTDDFHLLMSDYHDAIVLREYKNIDLLIVCEQSKVIIAIENKIWSRESAHQLDKYKDIVQALYPNYQILLFFLTPFGDDPSKKEWQAINYELIIQFIEKCIELKINSMDKGVLIFINQYIDLLRRHIVGDPELEKICRDIYIKHKDALDLIYEHKPDIYSEIYTSLTNLIETEKDLIKDGSNKKFIRFIPSSLDKDVFRCCPAWTESKRILLFEFVNYNNRLTLSLVLGPGPEDLREKIYQIAITSPELKPSKSLSKQYSKLNTKLIYDYSNIDEYNIDAIVTECTNKARAYINSSIDSISHAITSNFE